MLVFLLFLISTFLMPMGADTAHDYDGGALTERLSRTLTSSSVRGKFRTERPMNLKIVLGGLSLDVTARESRESSIARFMTQHAYGSSSFLTSNSARCLLATRENPRKVYESRGQV